MKKVILLVWLLCLSVSIAFADGVDAFSKAAINFNNGNYAEAIKLFEQCLNSPQYALVKDNIRNHIEVCKIRIEEQRRNVEQYNRDRAKREEEKKKNGYFYIEVIAQSADISNSVLSTLSEIVRRNNKPLCQKMEDAWTVITVFTIIKENSSNDGFFVAEGEGMVNLGNADKTEFMGQWSVDGEAVSPVSQNDAERLMRNQLNFKLANALDNLINNRPQSIENNNPKQTITVKFQKIEKYDISFLREALYGYISKTPGVRLSTAIDEERNQERDNIAITEAKYVKRDERKSVRALDGFNQVLYISVQEADGFLTFAATIEEHASGIILTTTTFDGSTFGINSENIKTAKKQELVAKMLAVGLGFHRWEVGEDIDGLKLAFVDGLHGKLIYVAEGGRNMKNTKYLNAPSNMTTSSNNVEEYHADRFRFPTIDELTDITRNEVRQKTGLSGVYWTSDFSSSKHRLAFDVSSKVEIAKPKVAKLLYIREF